MLAFAIIIWLWRLATNFSDEALLLLVWGPAAASTALVLAACGLGDSVAVSFGQRVHSGPPAVIFVWLIVFVVLFAATLIALVVVHLLPRISG